MRVIARNYRCRTGEIDVVAEDRGTVVFVEVKERAATRTAWRRVGHPL
jgi:putative endonuclease